jgi:hypothetical protein
MAGADGVATSFAYRSVAVPAVPSGVEFAVDLAAREGTAFFQTRFHPGLLFLRLRGKVRMGAFIP